MPAAFATALASSVETVFSHARRWGLGFVIGVLRSGAQSSSTLRPFPYGGFRLLAYLAAAHRIAASRAVVDVALGQRMPSQAMRARIVLG